MATLQEFFDKIQEMELSPLRDVFALRARSHLSSDDLFSSYFDQTVYEDDSIVQPVPSLEVSPPSTPTLSLPLSDDELKYSVLTSPESPSTPVAIRSRRKRQRMDQQPKPNIEGNKSIDSSSNIKLENLSIPDSSSPTKIQALANKLRDPTVCRLCADTFCRDETKGDPHLISCAKCGDKYHTFCADVKPSKALTWECYKCTGVQPPSMRPFTAPNPALICALCQQPDKTGMLEGTLIGPFHSLSDISRNYVHENCAFYSKGVVKIHDKWYCLPSAVRMSHTAKCSFCREKGASIPCDFAKCRRTFHFRCAKTNGCFTEDYATGIQQLYCEKHNEYLQKHPNYATQSKESKGEDVPPPLVASEPALQKSKKQRVSPRKVNRVQ
jgi:hypothetical protein